MMAPAVTHQCPIAYELEELGDLVRFRRSMLRLNLADAASRVGVSKYVMYRLEKGKAVRTDSLVKVFQGLGLAIAGRAVNRTGFTLPPLDKAQHAGAGGPVPGKEPSTN